MYKIFLVIIPIFFFSLLTAENPSSTNYELQQWGFTSGNDPANPPTSANYTLTGSAIGIISDEDAVSTNYGMLPGYYLGPIIGEILPPENVMISVVSDVVYLTWDAVTGANSYSVFSSSDPYASYETWDLEESGILVENWSETVPGTKLFYYVKASTSTSRFVNPTSRINNKTSVKRENIAKK